MLDTQFEIAKRLGYLKEDELKSLILAVAFTILVVVVAIAPIVRLIKVWYRKQAKNEKET